MLAVGNVEQGIVGVVIMPFVVVVLAFPDIDFVVHSKEGGHAVIAAKACGCDTGGVLPGGGFPVFLYCVRKVGE